MRPAPPRSVLSPDKQTLPPPRVDAPLRFTSNRKLVCWTFPSHGVQNKNLASFWRRKHQIWWWKISLDHSSILPKAHVRRRGWLFFFFVCNRLVKYKLGILNQTFGLIARRCQSQPALHVQASNLVYLVYPDGCCWWGILACGGMGYWPPTLCCCCCCCCMYCW